MSHADEDPYLARRNLIRRCRQREDMIIKKAHKLFLESNTNVYVLFHRANNNMYQGFTTQPGRDFPPSAKILVSLLARFPYTSLLNNCN